LDWTCLGPVLVFPISNNFYIGQNSRNGTDLWIGISRYL
jgi:hypothetical protein